MLSYSLINIRSFFISKTTFFIFASVYYQETMTEDFLHYIWKFKLFAILEFTSTEGEKIEIIKSGEHNTDAGPDFFNGKIKIGKTIWAGNIEVHVNASDWNKHNHSNNKAFDNIILHVVYNADEIIKRKNGEPIPTLEIKNAFDKKLYSNYLNFKSSKDWIPCAKQIQKATDIVLNSTIDKLLVERLGRKSETITKSLILNKNNWEETFYHHLARNFGFKTNAEPFELLAKSIPLNVLAKHKNSLLQIEALLFGQAGFLDEHYNDKYLLSLQNEYILLKHKFKLKPIDKHLWKFLRLYPANFPTIRIAQFANLVFNSSHLFSKIIETENIDVIKKLLNANTSEYWETHYKFDVISRKKIKNLGSQSVDIILINTIIPFLFIYGKQMSDEKYIERALLFLEKTKGEKNSITKNWDLLKVPIKSAYQTQALLQLKNEYCSNKKCLQCTIGNYLLKNV